MSSLEAIVLPAAMLLVLAYAAAVDVVRFQIPNTVSILIAGLAIAEGLLTPDYPWGAHLLAAVIMFAFGLLAFSLGWLGGGDVKLMTALSVWTGLLRLPVFFLATALAGGLLVLGLMLLRQVASWRGAASTAPEVLRPGARIPYGVAIAAGAVWIALATPILKAH